MSLLIKGDKRNLYLFVVVYETRVFRATRGASPSAYKLTYTKYIIRDKGEGRSSG